MKKLLLAAATAAAFTTSAAHAQTPAPTPEHTLTGNMTIATDYRFRGISQTFGEGFFKIGPAIQGGIDYSHSSGFYLGNWNSNVSGNQFPNGSSIEMDFYGGWKHGVRRFRARRRHDLLRLSGRHQAARGRSGRQYNFTDVNNWEAYLGGSWKWFSLKYSYPSPTTSGSAEDVITNVVACNPNRSCSPLPRERRYQGYAVPDGRVQLRGHA